MFVQAATEVLNSLEPLIKKENKHQKHAILECVVIPERTVIFRVTYTDDDGRPQVHNGYRVQFNSAVGQAASDCILAWILACLNF